MDWSLSDFVFAGALLSGLGMAVWFVARGPRNLPYRLAVGVAVGAALLMVWVTGAVGIVGSERHAANGLYFLAVGVGVIGAALARFQARGTAFAAGATALATAAIGLVAVLVGWGDDAPRYPLDVLGGSFLLAAMFAASAWLFAQSETKRVTF
jgi:hypothetical protein